MSVLVLCLVSLHSSHTACHGWRGTTDGVCHVEIIKTLKTDVQRARLETGFSGLYRE